jgi:hypothetical protein
MVFDLDYDSEDEDEAVMHMIYIPRRSLEIEKQEFVIEDYQETHQHV